jgi:chromosome segregation ATPase
MPIPHPELVLPFASGLLAVGGAYGGVKAALNGTVARQQRLEDYMLRIESKLDGLGRGETDLARSTAALQAELALIVARIDRVQATVTEIVREWQNLTERLAHIEGACPHCDIGRGKAK